MVEAPPNDVWKNAREIIAGGKLSVIMPAYRLAGRIGDNIARVAAVLEGQINYEIVPVDDGSGDGTADDLRAAAAKNPNRVKPVLIEQNAGKGNALKVGFRASTGDFALLLDGDLDLLPERIPEFFDSMAKNGSDIVLGSKRHPKSEVRYPWHRRLASAVYYTLVRILVGLPVTDTQTGMKLFRRKFLGEALDRMLVKTYAFDLELLSIAYGRGAKISEAPITLVFQATFGALKPKAVREVLHDTLAIFYRLRLLKYYSKVEVPPATANAPLVSIVIACPADSWMLQECLKGIVAQTYRNYEVLVLPDFPITQTPQCPNTRVIPTGKVRPAEKRNLGIKEAKGEIIAFIDDDAYPDAHWLEYAIKYFGEETIGGVGGPGVTPSNDGYLARVGGRVYDNLLVSGNYRYRYKAGGVRRDVDDYPSCNLFVRKDLLDSFGGYRTDFWPGEDTLLCKDIVDAGKRIVYDPWVIVNHHRRKLFGPHLRQLGRYAFHRGYFCKRYPSNSLHLSYFIPSLFVAYLLVGLPLAFWLANLGRIETPEGAAGVLLMGPAIVYLAAVSLSTFSVNPLTWFLTSVGVFASHVCYGVQFIRGLCASKAPCEFIGKDHV